MNKFCVNLLWHFNGVKIIISRRYGSSLFEEEEAKNEERKMKTRDSYIAYNSNNNNDINIVVFKRYHKSWF